MQTAYAYMTGHVHGGYWSEVRQAQLPQRESVPQSIAGGPQIPMGTSGTHGSSGSSQQAQGSRSSRPPGLDHPIARDPRSGYYQQAEGMHADYGQPRYRAAGYGESTRNETIPGVTRVMEGMSLTSTACGTTGQSYSLSNPYSGYQPTSSGYSLRGPPQTNISPYVSDQPSHSAIPQSQGQSLSGQLSSQPRDLSDVSPYGPVGTGHSTVPQRHAQLNLAHPSTYHQHKSSSQHPAPVYQPPKQHGSALGQIPGE